VNVRTSLMVAIRIILIVFALIVLALFLARRAHGGPSHVLLRPVAEVAAGRAAAVMVIACAAYLGRHTAALIDITRA